MCGFIDLKKVSTKSPQETKVTSNNLFQIAIFQAGSGAPFQNSKAAKLVDQNEKNVLIPPVVTEVPSIEIPTKFEDLLQDPKIVFKSITGLPSSHM